MLLFFAKAPAEKSSHIRQTHLQARFIDSTPIPFARRIAISSISCKSPQRKKQPSPPDISPDPIRRFRPPTICTQNRYFIDFVQKPPPENIATFAKPLSKPSSSISPPYHLHTECSPALLFLQKPPAENRTYEIKEKVIEER